MSSAGEANLVVATVPPSQVVRGIEPVREALCRRYGEPSVAKMPIHVELRSSIQVPEDAVDAFIEEFGLLIREWEPFRVRTDALCCQNLTFDGEKMPSAYLPVRKDLDLLEFNRCLAEYPRFRIRREPRFNPAIVLARGFLTKDEMKEIEALAKDEPDLFGGKFEWTCDNVTLYERQGSDWEQWHVFRLQEARFRADLI